MTFIDDFVGRSRAGQIALVQAVAREYGDQLVPYQATFARSTMRRSRSS